MQEDEEEQEGGRWEAELSLQALPLPPDWADEQTGETGRPGEEDKSDKQAQQSKMQCVHEIQEQQQDGADS